MDTVLYALCAVAGWVAFGYVRRLLRRRPDPARRAMGAAIGSFAAGITIAIPALARVIDHAAHLPNLAKILSHAGAMGIASSAEIRLLFLTLPEARARRRAHRWALQSAVAYTVMVALWIYTLTRRDPVGLTVEYARVPAVTGYLLLFLIFGFLIYCADISRMCWRFAGVAGRPWLRRGMRITAVGALLALGYCVEKVGYLTAYLIGRHPGGERQIAAVVVTLAAFAMLTGLTIPAWGPLLTRVRTWIRHRRAERRLRPLWADICRTLPELVLDGGLHRRVVEIYDGRLALQPFIDAAVAGAATDLADRSGLAGEERRAVVEAAKIDSGVRAAAAGRHPARPAAPDWHTPDGGYEEEVTWLVRVADAYARSPIVSELRHRGESPDEVPLRQPAPHPRAGSGA
jgi:hypothetical protein